MTLSPRRPPRSRRSAGRIQPISIPAARNVAASLGHGKARAYRHHDLGFAVDLTGRNAVATPLGVRLSGYLAKLAARAYHLRALPSGRLRVLSDWVNALMSGRQIVEVGLVDERYATIQAEASGPGETVAARRVDVRTRTRVSR